MVDEAVETISALRSNLSDIEREEFDLHYTNTRKSPQIALVISFLFGALGVDRFYVGQIWVGIAKLITFGGLGLWWFIDLFLIMGIIRDRNEKNAREIRDRIISARHADDFSLSG